MNFNKKKKKGFTIVELVIVIAVIGVLAAILIPTFVGLVNKANVAADNTLVRELNNALALDLAESGKTNHETMHEALEATKEYGFDVSRIDAKASKNKILWDSENGVFCYLKDGELEYVPNSVQENKKLSKTSYKLWIIASDVDETYSTYLYKASEKEFETSKGLDVGNEEVTAITYEHTSGDAQTVTIRTNSADTELVINAPNDTVKHYDSVGKVHVVAVDPLHCYEENGKAAFTQVDSGKYKTTATADVELLFVSSASNVSLELATGTVDHAHAISKADAGTLSTSSVTFDYDGNSEQNDCLDVYHHVESVDQLGLTAVYNDNKTNAAVTEVVDKLAGEEVAAANQNGANYIARIGAKGYESFSKAVTDANGTATILLLKDFTLNEEVDLNTTVELSKSLTITFVEAGTINLETNGSIVATAEKKLTLTGSVRGGGILYCQPPETVIEEDGARAVVSGTIVYQSGTEEVNGEFELVHLPYGIGYRWSSDANRYLWGALSFINIGGQGGIGGPSGDTDPPIPIP